MKEYRQVLCFSLFVCLCLLQKAEAQLVSSKEQLLRNACWQYSYSTALPEQQIIQKAQRQEPKTICFLPEGKALQQVGTDTEQQRWSIASDSLFLRIGFIESWRIAYLNKRLLVLEYQLPNGRSYQNYYRALQGEEKPEQYQIEEDIIPIYAGNQPQKQEKYRHLRDEKGKRGRQKRKSTRDYQPEAPLIQIEMIGGGYFGGPDPIYRNMLVIYSDGRVLHEIKSEKQGLRVSKKQIARQTLEELAEFIEKKRFFDFEQSYPCQSRACQERLMKEPRPVAFRLVVTYKHRRKVVALPIWEGPNKANGLLDYPEELDAIVQAIERLALP